MSLYETSTQDNLEYLESRREIWHKAEIGRLRGIVEQQKAVLGNQTKLLARIHVASEKLYKGEIGLTAFMDIIKPDSSIEI